ncbi:MAG: SRPBCC family protein [Actinomycetia bacterium]|jgi:hypothetical protein|nr:SRPBCC family protein [Actinomycetes bacterium]
MTTELLHKRSVHIDAPVEKVFDYVKDPHHFFAAFPEKDRSHMALAEESLTPEGVGSTWKIMGRIFLLFYGEWVLTREEYVPNGRIVDHANLGGVWDYTFEPDETGTTLSIGFGWSSKVPFLGEVIDRVSWDGDRDLDLVLGNLKKAIES